MERYKEIKRFWAYYVYSVYQYWRQRSHAHEYYGMHFGSLYWLEHTLNQLKQTTESFCWHQLDIEVQTDTDGVV